MFKNIPFKFSKVLGNELGLIKLLFFIIWCVCQPLLYCDQIITIPEQCLTSRKTLGMIESSAYPLIGGSTSANQAYDAISIKGQAYVGVRGLLKTWRDNIWVQTETISTYEDGDILPGHGFDSNKDLLLQAGSVNVPFSIVKAGQWLNMWTVYNAINSEFYIKTYGSHIQAGNSLCINTVNWAGDSRLETEGGILSIPTIEFGRTFNYFGKSICFSTKKVRDDLTRGPDIYGHFINFYEKDVAYPPLTKEEWVINGIWKA